MTQINNTWIKLPRSFASWRWYHDSKMVHLFLYLLLQANVRQANYLSLTVLPGQVVTSLAQIAEDTGLSVRNVRTCLSKLSSTKDIVVQANRKGSIVTLCNYDCFQQLSDDDAAAGWIKLYRKITDWNWYHDAQMLHVFIHLLLNAIYQQVPGASLERAQLSISQNSLRKETHIPISKVVSCLTALERTGEIEISHSPSPHPNLITICNYSLYQGFSNDSNFGDMEHGHKYSSQPFTISKDSDRNFCVNRYVSSDYEQKNFSCDKQTTNERHILGTLLTECRHIPDMLPTTKLEGYKEENDRISSSMRAYMREEDSLTMNFERRGKKPSKESYYFELCGDFVWIEAVKRRFRLKSPQEVMAQLEVFELDMTCRGRKAHKDLQDYQCHFCDWLSKQNIDQPKSSYGSKFTPRSSEGGSIYAASF